MPTKTKTKTYAGRKPFTAVDRARFLPVCRSCPQSLGGPYYRKDSQYCIDCELKHESTALMRATKTYAQRNYGNRCRDFEPGCFTCRMWQCHDTLELLICDEPGPHDNYRD